MSEVKTIQLQYYIAREFSRSCFMVAGKNRTDSWFERMILMCIIEMSYNVPISQYQLTANIDVIERVKTLFEGAHC